MENKFTVKKQRGEWIKWDCGYPLGNGRLGAMVPGQVLTECIGLNHDALWYGPYKNRNNPDAIKYYKQIRQLMKEGNVKEADKLCYMAMTSLPKYFGAYQPLGNMFMYSNHSHNISGYRKELDFETGIATVEYEADGMKIRREHFVSYPKQAFIMRITADKPNLDIHFNIMRRPCDDGTEILENNILHMPGQCGPDGVKFSCVFSAKTDGEMSRIGDYFGFKNASEIIIYVAVESDFYEKDPLSVALLELNTAMATDYDTLKDEHIKDFSSLYNRSAIDFGTKWEGCFLDRIDNLKDGNKDIGLLEMMFNYAKYLLISCSRPGSQAANLQGIWNQDFAPSWECNYTVNINTQMNYWMAELANLPECHEPLFSLIERMVPNGEQTAREVYGCGGFMSHHTTNLWGDTAIEGNSFPSSVWPMGGAWLCKHLWDHYLYTQDKDFLEKRAFPIMKKAAIFYTEYCDKDDEGYYITGPSLSPENVYITEEGCYGRHCMAPEMDNQIMRGLFRAVIKSYEILDCRDETYDTFCDFHAHLRPTRINKRGGIMEWDKDYDEKEPNHRHISPLFALYPDYEITTEKTPELAEACKKTIELRRKKKDGDCVSPIRGFSGWNGAWLSCCYAKLGMAEEAVDALHYILNTPGTITDSLLNRYPIFQIECNFGFATAVTELLLTSNEEAIHLLPALPKELSDGSFRGLCTRGGFILDAEWKNGKATMAKITSRNGGICRIKANGAKGVDTDYTIDSNYLVFRTEAGKTYELQF